MNAEDTYQQDHKLAKAVICSLYILLGAISIEIDNPYVALVIGTFVWFFGVNTMGYVIESLLKHEHRHNLI